MIQSGILQSEEYKRIINASGSAVEGPHVEVEYHLKCPAETNISVGQMAGFVAINTSIGTLQKLPFEDDKRRHTECAKITEFHDKAGYARIAYPIQLCEPRTGLTHLLGLISYTSEYNYTSCFRIEQIKFPEKYLSFFPGPRYGIQGIRDQIEIGERALVGAIIKPRAGVTCASILEQCTEAYLGGVDYISDDELIVDPESDLCFNARVEALSRLASKMSATTGQKKWYIANVASSPARSLDYAKRAKQFGANGILINAFTMGFSVIEDLVANKDMELPVFTSNMGTAMITRADGSTGMSEKVVALLSRIGGADGVNSGIAGSNWYNAQADHQALSNLRGTIGELRPSFPIVAGGLNVANLVTNLHEQGTDIMLLAGSGILGYPKGPRKGAKLFRQIVERFDAKMTEQDAESNLISLAKKNSELAEALTLYGFSPKYRKR